VQETAEQVASMHHARLTLTDDGQSGGLIRRLKLERPVGTMPVVMLDVDTQALLHCAITPSGCLHFAAQTWQTIATIEWFESFLAAFG
jgi:hypothetical protein